MGNLYVDYYAKVTKHKKLVFDLGSQLFPDLLDNFAKHDLSKFSPAEFKPYAHYFGEETKTEYTKLNFYLAWEHHIRCNPHHPEHWILSVKSDTLIPMPLEYVKEMVVDLQAMELQYGKGIDMSSYLNTNKKVFHSQTEVLFREVLEELGYFYNQDTGFYLYEPNQILLDISNE